MGYLVLASFIFILALAGKSILGFTPVLALHLALSNVLPSEIGLAIGFFSGILLSILDGNMIGQDSLGLILAMGVLYSYRRKFSQKHFIYSAVFSGVGSVVYSLVAGRELLFSKIAVDVVLVFLFLPILRSWQQRFFSEGIVLKL